ncbi:hypothetical protein VXE29_11205 [Acinetobacter variabilis]|uniref:hypothetical protein n=1 Tax=Acinetobacter variabilis TaxID=70346 RepID=UPI0030FA1235
MINSKNIICPDDKDIYTTLQSNNINNSVLEDLFLNHYTLTSNRGNRENRALYFSRSPLSHDDYLTIKNTFDKEKRRKETTKGILLGTNLSFADIRDHLEAEKNILIDLNHTSDLKIIPVGNKIVIKVDYIVYDFSKNLFNGQDHLSTEIILNFDRNSQVFIESTNDKNVDKWQRKIIDIIQKNTEKDSYKEIEISLFGIHDQEKKLKFFSDLIENIPGFTYQTVVDIFVSRKKEDNSPADETEEEEDTTEDVNRYIKKASFKGSKLLDSETVLKLLEKHYHIYRIIWQASDNTKPNEIYQFEVKFNNPEDCTDFAYSIHGKFVDRKSKISVVPFDETKPITSLIFQQARGLMDQINLEISKNPDTSVPDSQSNSES